MAETNANGSLSSTLPSQAGQLAAGASGAVPSLPDPIKLADGATLVDTLARTLKYPSLSKAGNWGAEAHKRPFIYVDAGGCATIARPIADGESDAPDTDKRGRGIKGVQLDPDRMGFRIDAPTLAAQYGEGCTQAMFVGIVRDAYLSLVASGAVRGEAGSVIAGSDDAESANDAKVLIQLIQALTRLIGLPSIIADPSFASIEAHAVSMAAKLASAGDDDAMVRVADALTDAATSTPRKRVPSKLVSILQNIGKALGIDPTAPAADIPGPAGQAPTDADAAKLAAGAGA